MTKPTKKQMFTQIRAHLTDPAEIAFIDNEIELLNRKNTKRAETLTKKQRENLEVIDKIYACMDEGVGYRASAIPALIGDTEMSVNKASALLKSMLANGKATRAELKNVAYFYKV